MKSFLLRILLAAGVTLVVSALASSAHAQQPDADSTPVSPKQTQSTATPQSPQQHDSSDAAAHDAQTQDALAFTGRVMKEQGQLVLNDPVTKLNYQLDDQTKARPYIGKQVKVIGKLEMNSNTIHIASIEPLM